MAAVGVPCLVGSERCRLMKALLVIDHFGSGGAQRQLVELACGLSRRGHEVEVFIYHPRFDFFRPRIDQHGIVVHEYEKRGRLGIGVVMKLAQVIRNGDFDVAVSYLKSTNVYSEFATLISSPAKLVVSERTSYHDDAVWLTSLARRLLHGLADHVVTNSVNQREWLRRKPWLRNKVSSIYNGLDLQHFSPRPVGEKPTSNDFRLLGIGRVGPEKNVANLVRGLRQLAADTGTCPRVSWVGPRDESARGQRYCAEVDALIDAAPVVRENWRWLGLRSDVSELLGAHDALVHPSLYEGLPNVVCEALASGVPVLASNVCDHPLLVVDGERGFLFDPLSPDSIANAISCLQKLDADGRHRLSQGAREFAVDALGIEKMVSAYENLFRDLRGTASDASTQSQ